MTKLFKPKRPAVKEQGHWGKVQAPGNAPVHAGVYTPKLRRPEDQPTGMLGIEPQKRKRDTV